MAVIGVNLGSDSLILQRGRDFRWVFVHLDENRQPSNYPAGSLFFELKTGDSPTIWDFTISGSQATIKVESTEVDLIEPRTVWQLVFMPSGESAGGDPVAFGTVKVQG